MDCHEIAQDMNEFFGKKWRYTFTEWQRAGIKYSDFDKGLIDPEWLLSVTDIARKEERTTNDLALVGQYILIHVLKKMTRAQYFYLYRSYYTESIFDELTLEIAKMHRMFKNEIDRPYSHISNCLEKLIRQKMWRIHNLPSRKLGRDYAVARTMNYLHHDLLENLGGIVPPDIDFQE